MIYANNFETFIYEANKSEVFIAGADGPQPGGRGRKAHEEARTGEYQKNTITWTNCPMKRSH